MDLAELQYSRETTSPNDGSGQAENEELAVPAKKPRGRRPIGGPNRNICQVPGCSNTLETTYAKKYRVCLSHMRQPQVVLNGESVRFCQKCSRFHTLDFFDGPRRTCRVRLHQHNSRRRFIRGIKRAMRKDMPIGDIGDLVNHPLTAAFNSSGFIGSAFLVPPQSAAPPGQAELDLLTLLSGPQAQPMIAPPQPTRPLPPPPPPPPLPSSLLPEFHAAVQAALAGLIDEYNASVVPPAPAQEPATYVPEPETAPARGYMSQNPPPAVPRLQSREVKIPAMPCSQDAQLQGVINYLDQMGQAMLQRRDPGIMPPVLSIPEFDFK